MKISPPIAVLTILASALLLPPALSYIKKTNQLSQMHEKTKLIYADEERFSNSPQNYDNCGDIPEQNLFVVRVRSKSPEPPLEMDTLISDLQGVYEIFLRADYKEKIYTNTTEFCELATDFREINTVILWADDVIKMTLAYGDHLKGYCGLKEKNYYYWPLPLGGEYLNLADSNQADPSDPKIDPNLLFENLKRQARRFGDDGVCFNTKQGALK